MADEFPSKANAQVFDRIVRAEMLHYRDLWLDRIQAGAVQSVAYSITQAVGASGVLLSSGYGPELLPVDRSNHVNTMWDVVTAFLDILSMLRVSPHMRRQIGAVHNCMVDLLKVLDHFKNTEFRYEGGLVQIPPAGLSLYQRLYVEKARDLVCELWEKCSVINSESFTLVDGYFDSELPFKTAKIALQPFQGLYQGINKNRKVSGSYSIKELGDLTSQGSRNLLMRLEIAIQIWNRKLRMAKGKKQIRRAEKVVEGEKLLFELKCQDSDLINFVGRQYMDIIRAPEYPYVDIALLATYSRAFEKFAAKVRKTILDVLAAAAQSPGMP